ncbi:MAG: Aspartyl/glutamyl-tRNA(Asn/Gln) amidotransferase subunit B, partial [uncultured bacterium]
EEANDYRYFPDPDLLPVVLEEQFIEKIKETLPELPQQKCDRFKNQYGLPDQDAAVLSMSREWGDYFEEVVKASGAPSKLCANWIRVELAAILNKNNLDITQSPLSALQLAGLMKRIHDNTISGKIAKIVFEAMLAGEGEVDSIIEKRNLRQVTDGGAIEKMIDTVLAAHPEQVQQYRSGKERVFGFLVGQVMKASKGQANPQQLNEILLKKLKQS